MNSTTGEPPTELFPELVTTKESRGVIGTNTEVRAVKDKFENAALYQKSHLERMKSLRLQTQLEKESIVSRHPRRELLIKQWDGVLHASRMKESEQIAMSKNRRYGDVATSTGYVRRRIGEWEELFMQLAVSKELIEATIQAGLTRIQNGRFSRIDSNNSAAIADRTAKSIVSSSTSPECSSYKKSIERQPEVIYSGSTHVYKASEMSQETQDILRGILDSDESCSSSNVSSNRSSSNTPRVLPCGIYGDHDKKPPVTVAAVAMKDTDGECFIAISIAPIAGHEYDVNAYGIKRVVLFPPPSSSTSTTTMSRSGSGSGLAALAALAAVGSVGITGSAAAGSTVVFGPAGPAGSSVVVGSGLDSSGSGCTATTASGASTAAAGASTTAAATVTTTAAAATTTAATATTSAANATATTSAAAPLLQRVFDVLPRRGWEKWHSDVALRKKGDKQQQLAQQQAKKVSTQVQAHTQPQLLAQAKIQQTSSRSSSGNSSGSRARGASNLVCEESKPQQLQEEIRGERSSSPSSAAKEREDKGKNNDEREGGEEGRRDERGGRRKEGRGVDAVIAITTTTVEQSSSLVGAEGGGGGGGSFLLNSSSNTINAEEVVSLPAISIIEEGEAMTVVGEVHQLELKNDEELNKHDIDRCDGLSRHLDDSEQTTQELDDKDEGGGVIDDDENDYHGNEDEDENEERRGSSSDYRYQQFDPLYEDWDDDSQNDSFDSEYGGDAVLSDSSAINKYSTPRCEGPARDLPLIFSSADRQRATFWLRTTDALESPIASPVTTTATHPTSRDTLAAGGGGGGEGKEDEHRAKHSLQLAEQGTKTFSLEDEAPNFYLPDASHRRIPAEQSRFDINSVTSVSSSANCLVLQCRGGGSRGNNNDNLQERSSANSTSTSTSTDLGGDGDEAVVFSGTLNSLRSCKDTCVTVVRDRFFEWTRGAALSGWMYKWPMKSQYAGRRTKRFFVLRGNTIHYFRKDPNAAIATTTATATTATSTATASKPLTRKPSEAMIVSTEKGVSVPTLPNRSRRSSLVASAASALSALISNDDDNDHATDEDEGDDDDAPVGDGGQENLPVSLELTADSSVYRGWRYFTPCITVTTPTDVLWMRSCVRSATEEAAWMREIGRAITLLKKMPLFQTKTSLECVWHHESPDFNCVAVDATPLPHNFPSSPGSDNTNTRYAHTALYCLRTGTGSTSHHSNKSAVEDGDQPQTPSYDVSYSSTRQHHTNTTTSTAAVPVLVSVVAATPSPPSPSPMMMLYSVDVDARIAVAGGDSSNSNSSNNEMPVPCSSARRQLQLLAQNGSTNLGSELSCVKICGNYLVFGGSNGFVGLGMTAELNNRRAMYCLFPSALPNDEEVEGEKEDVSQPVDGAEEDLSSDSDGDGDGDDDRNFAHKFLAAGAATIATSINSSASVSLSSFHDPTTATTDSLLSLTVLGASATAAAASTTTDCTAASRHHQSPVAARSIPDKVLDEALAQLEASVGTPKTRSRGYISRVLGVSSVRTPASRTKFLPTVAKDTGSGGVLRLRGHSYDTTITCMAASQNSSGIFIAGDSNGCLSLWKITPGKPAAAPISSLSTDDVSAAKAKALRAVDDSGRFIEDSFPKLTLQSFVNVEDLGGRDAGRRDERIISVQLLPNEDFVIVSTNQRLLLVVIGERKRDRDLNPSQTSDDGSHAGRSSMGVVDDTAVSLAADETADDDIPPVLTNNSQDAPYTYDDIPLPISSSHTTRDDGVPAPSTDDDIPPVSPASVPITTPTVESSTSPNVTTRENLINVPDSCGNPDIWSPPRMDTLDTGAVHYNECAAAEDVVNNRTGPPTARTRRRAGRLGLYFGSWMELDRVPRGCRGIFSMAVEEEEEEQEEQEGQEGEEGEGRKGVNENVTANESSSPIPPEEQPTDRHQQLQQQLQQEQQEEKEKDEDEDVASNIGGTNGRHIAAAAVLPVPLLPSDRGDDDTKPRSARDNLPQASSMRQEQHHQQQQQQQQQHRRSITLWKLVVEQEEEEEEHSINVNTSRQQEQQEASSAAASSSYLTTQMRKLWSSSSNGNISAGSSNSNEPPDVHTHTPGTATGTTKTQEKRNASGGRSSATANADYRIYRFDWTDAMFQTALQRLKPVPSEALERHLSKFY